LTNAVVVRVRCSSVVAEGVGILSWSLSRFGPARRVMLIPVSQPMNGAIEMDPLEFHQPAPEDGLSRRGCLAAVQSLPRERGEGGEWR
jgi:hypothetical protein